MFECLIGGGFRYSIRGVTIPFNPPDLRKLSTLVRLTKGHNIDYEPLFLGGSKLNEALIEGEAVYIYNNGEVSNSELLADQGVYYREGNGRIYTCYH
jgi:hypothetical protein